MFPGFRAGIISLLNTVKEVRITSRIVELFRPLGYFKGIWVFSCLSHLSCPTLNCLSASPCISPSPALFQHVYPLHPFLPHHNPIHVSFTSLKVVEKGNKKKNKESERKKYKTSLYSPKQEHLLIVEVTVSVQPHALNTTLLVLMMHRSDGERRERLTEMDRERKCGSRWLFFFLPAPLFFLPFLLLTSPSTSILKGSSELSNLSAILYIIARLNPH